MGARHENDFSYVSSFCVFLACSFLPHPQPLDLSSSVAAAAECVRRDAPPIRRVELCRAAVNLLDVAKALLVEMVCVL